jgi:arsenate reductase-like glutaredoxin family protein
VAFHARDTFASPLTRVELEGLAALVTVDRLFSWKSPAARDYAGQRGRLPDERLIELMLGEPRLIRRPILVRDDRFVIGADPAEIAAFVDSA